jgi:phosphotransferase system HPr (HPr) family protein
VASEEHLSVLMRGPVAWNRWRTDHPEVTPDLAGADLAGRDLIEADLTGAILTNANLSEAKLFDDQDGYPRSADLTRAVLSGAALSRIRAIGVWFLRADLSGADLRCADLRHAYFFGADLTGARLDGAFVEDARFDYGITKGATFADLKGDASGHVLCKLEEGKQRDRDPEEICETTFSLGWVFGLHQRASHQVTIVSRDVGHEDAKSALGVMTLSVARGDTLKVTAVGPDAREAAEALRDRLEAEEYA